MARYVHTIVGALFALTILISLVLPVGRTPTAQAQYIQPPANGYSVYDRVREMAWWSGDRAYGPCLSAVDGNGVRYHCLGYPIDWDFTLPDSRAFCRIQGVDYRGAGVRVPRSESFVCNFDQGAPVSASQLPAWNPRPLPAQAAPPPQTGGYDSYQRRREMAWWTQDVAFSECLSTPPEMGGTGVRYHCIGFPVTITVSDDAIVCNGDKGQSRGPTRILNTESTGCFFERRAPRTDLPAWSERRIPPPCSNYTPMGWDETLVIEVRGMVEGLQPDEVFRLCEAYGGRELINPYGVSVRAAIPRPNHAREGWWVEYGEVCRGNGGCPGPRDFMSDGVNYRKVGATVPPPGTTPIPGVPATPTPTLAPGQIPVPPPGQIPIPPGSGSCNHEVAIREAVNSSFDPFTTGVRGIASESNFKKLLDGHWCSVTYRLGANANFRFVPGVRLENVITGEVVEFDGRPDVVARDVSNANIRWMTRSPNNQNFPPEVPVATRTPTATPTGTATPTPTPVCIYCNIN